MSDVATLLGKVDFTVITSACEELAKVLGVKIKTVAIKKQKVVEDFFLRLLETTPEQEKDLPEIIFTAESSLREALGVTTIRQALAILMKPTVPPTTPPLIPKEEPVIEEVLIPVEEVVPEPDLPVEETTAPEPPVVEVLPPETPPKKRGPKPKDKPPKEPKEPKPPKEKKAAPPPLSRTGRRVLDVTTFVWENLDLSLDEIAEGMKKAGIEYNESTLGFEYRAVHRSRQVLQEKKVLK